MFTQRPIRPASILDKDAASATQVHAKLPCPLTRGEGPSVDPARPGSVAVPCETVAGIGNFATNSEGIGVNIESLAGAVSVRTPSVAGLVT